MTCMMTSALSDHLCEDYLVFSILGQISQNIKYEILTLSFCVLYQVPQGTIKTLLLVPSHDCVRDCVRYDEKSSTKFVYHM